MREKKGYCPICNHYRTLRLLGNIYDRIGGLTIAKHLKIVDSLCYNCRKKIDKGIKEGKKFTYLRGKDFTVSGYGLPKYIDKIERELSINRISINKALGFIDFIYSKWIEIDHSDKFKYHFASLLIVLEDDDKRKQLENFIKIHYTNISTNELMKKVEEINKWCDKLSFDPYESIF